MEQRKKEGHFIIPINNNDRHVIYDQFTKVFKHAVSNAVTLPTQG